MYEAQTNRSEGRPAEESELIDRAKRGDLMAYEDLVRRHQDAALRTAVLLAGDPDDAAEAVQDAFVKAHATLDRFRSGAPLRPWLLRIVANEARNRRRSAGRRAGLALRLAEAQRTDDAAPSPEAAVLATERRAALLAALASMRDDDRLVIGYRFLLEMSEEETAEALAIARGTVKSRLSRALARLRIALAVGSGPASTSPDIGIGGRR